jgi:hypothetical protein
MTVRGEIAWRLREREMGLNATRGVHQFLTRKLDFLMGMRRFGGRCPALASVGPLLFHLQRAKRVTKRDSHQREAPHRLNARAKHQREAPIQKFGTRAKRPRHVEMLV